LDAYAVLGVPPGADAAQVRACYVRLAKLYHPDLFINTPQEAAAQARMREINAAYHHLRRATPKHPKPAGGRFAAVKELLAQGKAARAWDMLESMSPRNAAWHAMAAKIAQARGWQTKSAHHLARALELEPGNMTYRRALSALTQQAKPVVKPTPREGVTDRLLRNFFQ